MTHSGRFHKSLAGSRSYLRNNIFGDHFMKELLDLGMDVGSVSINTVVVNAAGEVIFEDYRRTRGEPLPTALNILQELQDKFSDHRFRLAAFTGIGGKLPAPNPGWHVL